LSESNHNAPSSSESKKMDAAGEPLNGSSIKGPDTGSSTNSSAKRSPLSDKHLFARISEGDEQAFQTVFHAYNKILYPYILSLVKIEADAKEVIQETFLQVWLKKDTLPDIENPGGWLYTLAANFSYLHLRKEARYVRRLHNVAAESAAGSNSVSGWSAPATNLNDIHEAFDSKEVKALIQEAVNKLPQRRRQVFQMSRLEGYSRREIAEFLGISENTVRNQLQDAVEFIQDQIRKNSSQYLPAILIGILAGLN